MRVVYKKHVLQDPQSEGGTYADYELQRDAEFCCDGLESYFKRSSGWDHELGRFVVVDRISYEGHSVRPIDFCPFCGERIEYEDVDAPAKKRKEQRASRKS